MRQLFGAVILGLALAGLARAEQGASPEPRSDRAAKEEAARLKKQLKRALAEVAALKKEVAAMRDRAVAAEIQARQARDRAEGLERKVLELARELARLKAGKGADARPANPPPEDLEGLVRQVKDGKIVISIGADAGLAKGHTLEAFRTGPGTKYLGRLRVIEVKAKEAICEPVNRATKVEKGDRVASRVAPR
jgi:hypothetical protein